MPVALELGLAIAVAIAVGVAFRRPARRPAGGGRRFGVVEAHRLLVAAFIGFAVFFAFLKVDAAREGGGAGEWALALASLAAAAGFAVYYRGIGAPGS